MSERTKVYILSKDYRQVVFHSAGGKARQYSEFIGVYTSIDQLTKKIKDILDTEHEGFTEIEARDDCYGCIKAYQRLGSDRDEVEYLYFDATEFYLNE